MAIVAPQPFSKIVVDKKEEARFRRRVLRRYPCEYLEALWGKLHGDILYIVAFVKADHKGTRRSLKYDEQELDFHEEDAAEHGLHFLGTIHSHPNVTDTRFGDFDLEDCQETQEVIIGIAAIEKLPNGRKKCRIDYWPAPRPFPTVIVDSKPRGRRKSNRKKA
jgi:proteasome lid subunit RPN8/RPN11